MSINVSKSAISCTSDISYPTITWLLQSIQKLDELRSRLLHLWRHYRKYYTQHSINVAPKHINMPNNATFSNYRKNYQVQYHCLFKILYTGVDMCHSFWRPSRAGSQLWQKKNDEIYHKTGWAEKPFSRFENNCSMLVVIAMNAL